MAFDFKKEYKALYLPKKKPSIIRVPKMNYLSVCVQCLHIGPYDDEPKTTAKMHQYMQEQGYFLDINDMRYHHEIYISDPRKCDPSKLKTVIRHPIKER